MASDSPSHTVIYDGNCTVCGRMVGVLREWDRSRVLEILPSQDPAVRARFPWIAPAAYETSIQLVGPDGSTWSGAAALRRILRVIRHGRVLSWLLALPGAEHAYAWFARHRYALGCGAHCDLPQRGDRF